MADIIIDDMKADVELKLSLLHSFCLNNEAMKAYKLLRQLISAVMVISAQTDDFDYFSTKYDQINKIVQINGMFAKLKKFNEIYDSMI